MATKAQSKLTPLTVVTYALVGLWLIIAAFPFLWTLWGSFKVQADFFSKADWTNAFYGTNTIKETGAAFTTKGYCRFLNGTSGGSSRRPSSCWSRSTSRLRFGCCIHSF